MPSEADVRRVFGASTDELRARELAKKKKPKKKSPGILDRLHGVATGLGGATQAPFGLVKDLANGAINDDEYGGIIDTLFSATKKRGGQLLSNTFGPDEGLGAAVGLVPEPVRGRVARTIEGVGTGALAGAGAGAVVGGVGAIPGAIVGAIGGGLYGAGTGRSTLEDLETVWREGISEPVTTAVTVGSLASTPEGGGIGGLLDPDKWREGYRTAQDRSPGQALALAFLTEDITDDVELAEAVGSQPYEIMSATTDAALRFVADPTVVGGKIVTAARRGAALTIRSADDINRVARNPKFLEWVDGLEGKSSTVIRDQYFPKAKHGGAIADALSFAPDGASRVTTARALMGDRAAREMLTAERPALAARIERLMGERSNLLEYADDGNLFAQPERLASVRAELAELVPEQARLDRLDAISEAGQLQTIPRPNQGATRMAIKRSDFYRESPFAAPLRATFEMIPARMANLHAPDGDIVLARNLEGSTLDQATRDGLRADYNAAANPTERQVVMIRAEETAVRKIAEDAGLTVDELDEVFRHARRGRTEADSVVRSRSYDGKGRGTVNFMDEDGTQHSINLPIFVTQEANMHSIVDLHAVRKAAEKIGTWRAHHPGATAAPAELLTGFYRLWKPGVLLRAGWPIRVVGEEQLRIMSKIGALSHLKYLAYAPGAVKEKAGAVVGGAAKRVGLIDELPVSSRLGIGERGFTTNGYEMQAAYGTPGDAAEQLRDLNSSGTSWEKLIGTNEKGELDVLRRKTSEYVGDIRPASPDYGAAWAHAVNRQFGQDAAGKRLMAGESVEDVVAWMKATPEGRQLAKRFHFRAGDDPTEWVQMMADVIDDYTVGNPALRQLALEGTATADDLAKAVPDAAARPIVHGEIVSQLTGVGIIKEWADRTVTRMYRGLGQLPTDTLSRNPFFDHTYRAEVSRLVGIADGQTPGMLAPDELRRIEHAARDYALGQSKDLLYDLAESSRLAEMLRFVSPFYNAWAEVLSRWSGLAADNPAFVARARLVYKAPERMGLAVDERGWERRSDGKALDPISGEWVPAKGDSYVVFSLPAAIRHLIPGLENQGEIAINKKSVNLAMQIIPGAGPPVAVAVNEIAKARPDLEQSLGFLMPYGITYDTKQLLLPTTARNAMALASGDEDRRYANARIRIGLTMATDYLTGKRADMPTFDEAEQAAKAFWSLRTAVSWLAPFSVQYNSPYQAQLESFRAAQERLRNDSHAFDDEDGNERTADEWFLDTFGDDMFYLTQSISKSNDGIPPTMKGLEARKKYEDLVEEMPELGGLIIGNDGAGEYSNFVYHSQAASKIKPGSSVPQRGFPDFDTTLEGPQVRRGWIEYTKMMDLIDAERIQRGLPNLQVKAAADLADIRRQVVGQLEEEYPAWAAERATIDTKSMGRRIANMRKIAADDRLAGREEIKGLREYLRLRDLVTAELAGRKSVTLDSTANQDLAFVWESLVGDLVEHNLAFGNLYHRWLDSDTLEVKR